jgi:pilus assembly protein CpaE
MTTIVERDPSLVETFCSTIGSGVTVLQSLDQLRRHLADRPDEYAVVLGPSVDLAAAAALADSTRVGRPALSVILVRRRLDTAILTDALRAGIREVVEDRDLTRLGEAVRRAYTLWKALTAGSSEQPAVTKGQLITVFAAKGGVGKSTVATNLAAALADEGTSRVCLIDLDIAFGDVAIMLQQLPKHTIADAVELPQLDPGALEAMLTPYSDSLFTLAAPVQPDATDRISSKQVGKILQMLKERFDYVVADTSPSFDDFVLQAFDQTDLLLLVATLDIPALKNLKVASDTLDLLNMPRSQWRLLLNRADAKVGLSPAEVEKTLGMSITTSIPSSRDVPASINRGALLVRSAPRHSVSSAIRDLARECLDATGGPALPLRKAEETSTEPETTRRGGLLRRKARTS